jgi:hypothetical protein
MDISIVVPESTSHFPSACSTLYLFGVVLLQSGRREHNEILGAVWVRDVYSGLLEVSGHIDADFLDFSDRVVVSNSGILFDFYTY